MAWLQCVGSRDVKYNSYCSSVCCMYAIKEAVIAMEHSKEPLETTIFYMDMRTYGKDFELYYLRAQELGVRFIRCRVHSLDPAPGGDVKVNYVTEEGEFLSETFDMVALSVGLQVSGEVIKLAEQDGGGVDAAPSGQDRAVYTGADLKAGCICLRHPASAQRHSAVGYGSLGGRRWLLRRFR